MNTLIQQTLDHIVGFRSRNKRKMKIAGIYYLIMILGFVVGANWITCISGLVLPTVIASIWDAFKTRSVKKGIFALVCLVIIALIAPADSYDTGDSVVVTLDEDKPSDGSLNADSAGKVKSDAISSDAGKDKKSASDGSQNAEIGSDGVKSGEVKSDGNTTHITESDGTNLDTTSLDGDKTDDAKSEPEKTEIQEEASLAAQQANLQETEQSAPPIQEDSNSRTVYVGKTGKKYHIEGCRTLKGKGRPITLGEALAQGRQACKVCGG